jgi:hypothetical protein
VSLAGCAFAVPGEYVNMVFIDFDRVDVLIVILAAYFPAYVGYDVEVVVFD